MEKEYMIWSDGVLSSMGVVLNKNLDGSYEVENPMNIVFATEQQPVQGKPGEFRSVMRFDLTPYIFGAVLTPESKNIWIVKPLHVLDNGKSGLNAKIIDAYEHTLKVTSTSKEK